jgi:RimJ/RimL family protein N-acetyltransferase
MAQTPPESALLARLLAGAARRAEQVLGDWLSPEVLERNLAQHVRGLLCRDPARADGRGRAAAQAALVSAEGWVAVAQALSTAESLPLPHAVLWAVAPLEGQALWPAPSVLGALSAQALQRLDVVGAAHTAVFLHGPPSAPPLELRAGLTPYKRWMAAPMARLQASPVPARSERVRVTTPADLVFWPEYVRMYEEFWESDGALRGRIGLERPEDLEEYISAGGLRLVWIDDELAGVIGGVRMVELGLRGWRLRERVLGGRWRGAGFGSAALDAVIRDLPAEPDDILWGTILPENRGSMGSAARLGRVDVGGLWWLGKGIGE